MARPFGRVFVNGASKPKALHFNDCRAAASLLTAVDRGLYARPLVASSRRALVLLSGAAAAEPIKLKFSFFTSDRSIIYQAMIKPFVDAVNNEGKDLLQIDVYFSGAISKVQAQQPGLVAEGVADLAIVVPGQVPELSTGVAVMELPGLFRDEREASGVFARLVAADTFSGFRDFVVIGTFMSGSENINSRKPLTSLAELNGQTIRVNNPVEAMTLEKLGAVPVLLAINETTEELSQGKIDGATVPPSMLFEFGISRLTSYHYMAHVGSAPVALVMSRDKFASLPPRAQEIIRKYSGEWLTDQCAKILAVRDAEGLAKLQSDSRRTVTFPSQSDEAAIQKVYASVVEQWASSNRHNRELLERVKTEIAKHRSNN